ncbi:hypothetical protein PQ472_11890 [Lacticaseibacillus pabuli]|uniref:Uncharacterized protein n=1 Tax=Lacticaseibacillus pabuli TaxID=3025672 RepID=A0ABY7WQW2_9LACO|nr:hypothetical protein [Lacticaseibacillus sp. KACC 23028]WDF82577.1 hypothetical protein PQ472_11890 [Lacticaseibacillus sp. KACC 23028]
MSKKSIVAAFIAGAFVGGLVSYAKLQLFLNAEQARVNADSATPAPTASQAVPRPGRPRPQMRAQGQNRPAKRIR